jgi:hypothetical protein
MHEFLQYTNPFGKVNKITTTLYPRGNSEADSNLWPEHSLATTDNAIMTFERTINKDAREKYMLNIQFPIISEDSSVIKVFPGIAKYSAMIRKKDDIDIGVALLKNGYKPTVNTNKLDKSKVIPRVGNIASFEYDEDNDIYGIKWNYLPIPAGDRYEGYVVYEKNTDELIYAVIEDIPLGLSSYDYDTDTVWFIPRKYLKDNTRPVES